MPSASIIAAALTTPAAKHWALWINGLDVLYDPVSTVTYGTHLDSIDVIEAGPGGVSSMTFTIADPMLAIDLSESDRVLFWDLTANVPLFNGFVQSWTNEPSAVGREIQVRCVGIEAVLDWAVVADSSYITNSDDHLWWSAMFQSMVYLSLGVGVPLNVAAKGPADGEPPWANPSNRASPIAYMGTSLSQPTSQTIDVGSLTLRQALDRVAEAWIANGNVTPWIAALDLSVSVTVDYYGGLRIWTYNSAVTPGPPEDYQQTFVVSQSGSDITASNLQHSTDVSGVVRQVVIIGGNAAGTGTFTDGSGIPGPAAILARSDSLTAAAANGIASAYLSERSSLVRGDFRIENYVNPSTSTSQVRPGTEVTLTNAQVGLSSYEDIVIQIEKTFQAGGWETWVVAYGGFPKSSVKSVRRLTRDTRS